MKSSEMISVLGVIFLSSIIRCSVNAAVQIPDYVNKYAPLVYLDQNELYMPSDIQAQLNNSNLDVNYTIASKAPSPLSLSNLEQANAAGNCTSFSKCPLYLTSKDNVTSNPAWLYGVLPDPTTYETPGIKSCAIISHDHGDGVVDAYYMYFYAFNLGENINGQILGNHIGDWEHTMVRFTNGTPTSIWYSQHDGGQTFTYNAVSKIGVRPIVYSAIGSHANFAVPGLHSRPILPVLILNDTTSAGPLWDPTLSAYYYTYQPTSSGNGTFTGSDDSTPVSWLYYLGAWGDKQYLDSDPRQVNFYNLNISWAYGSGPTGPLDKDLNRTGTCPGNASSCTTLSTLPASSGSSVPVTVTRASASTKAGTSAASTSASSTTGGSTASTVSTPSASASATGKSEARSLQAGIGLLGLEVAIGVMLSVL